MKRRWKTVFVWSSLGSVAVAALITLARKTRAPQPPLLECQRIPDECQRISLWTEQFHTPEGDGDLAAQDKYSLQMTPFKVWSVLELGADSAHRNTEGATVYHVTHLRYAGAASSEGYPDDGRLQDRFYGVITVIDAAGRHCPRNCLSRGGILEIRKCLVGGASNGVETGDVHLSAAPILNYRFEYSAR